ncbi:Phophatidylserine decarboxylase-domain-containing protein [Penicillium angulare]|uniref:Phophatidylserine decarboxylase-domain-containing protein n=1 Tax=Penicillium angulare TaxID=116970 RepID=A0A9W9FUL3_9EURO|nr:Phophatidylserine decarboxylase-domain-containing protein [Penicillium angulare]
MNRVNTAVYSRKLWRRLSKESVEDEDPVAWVWDIVTEASDKPQELHPTLQEFGNLIETNDRIGLLFDSMFQQSHSTKSHGSGNQAKIQDYQHMLQIFNLIISHAPPFHSKGVQIGLPMAALLRDYMATPSGFAAFLDPEVNAIFHRVLNAWGDFLQTPESAATLDDPSTGWFSNSSLTALAASGNTNGTTYRFDEIFECNPNAPYHGFRSWDDFFTRKFREGMRPIAGEDDDNIVVGACEAEPTQLARDVKARDTFWMKGRTYSLDQMLGTDYSSEFVGGTIYQGLLSAFNYHRWHAPVSGTIVKTYTIQGTYFSTPGAIDDGNGRLVNYPAYNSAMSTRSVTLINADNPAIGLIAFIAVGMVEVSSCEVTVKEGQHVKKGDEIGMFHYGGSTHCLIFKKGVNITGFPEGAGNVAVGSQFAVISP